MRAGGQGPDNRNTVTKRRNKIEKQGYEKT